MTIRVTFDLEEKDLKYFRANMRKAQAASKKLGEDEVIEKANQIVAEIKGQKVPQFVKIRVEKLKFLIDMLQDDEWSLEAQERKDVVAALAYFADPHDMIPDNIPVLGYIDDAIMIELVVAELQHEIDAFNDFCQFKKEEKARKRNPDASRDEWLEAKRRALHARMRRRRTAKRSSGSSTRTRFRLF